MPHLDGNDPDLNNSGDRNSHDPDEQDKLQGPMGRLAIAIAAVEFMAYWLLVFYFPAVMAPVSIILAMFAYIYWKKDRPLQELKQELGLSNPDLAILKKYCAAWVFISLYGLTFSIVLLV